MTVTCESLSILIVEDDKAAREILESVIAIKYPDAHIYSAGDGLYGLELFRSLQPGIVITDISMPKLDGLSMAREIRGIKPGTKFIVLTAHYERNALDVDLHCDFNFDCYLTKPVDFVTLFSAINKLYLSINP